jgi:hypothetical protein
MATLDRKWLTDAVATVWIIRFMFNQRQKIEIKCLTTVAVTKMHASRSQENRTTLQHEQRSSGEWRPLRTSSVAKLATLYRWQGRAVVVGLKSFRGLEACNLVSVAPRRADAWVSGGIVPRIPNLHTRWWWVVSLTPRPLYPRRKNPDTNSNEPGRSPEPVCTLWRREKSCPTGIESRSSTPQPTHSLTELSRLVVELRQTIRNCFIANRSVGIWFLLPFPEYYCWLH